MNVMKTEQCRETRQGNVITRIFKDLNFYQTSEKLPRTNNNMSKRYYSVNIVLWNH